MVNHSADCSWKKNPMKNTNKKRPDINAISDILQVVLYLFYSFAAPEPFSLNMLDCWLHLTVKVITFCHSNTIFLHLHVMALFKYNRTEIRWAAVAQAEEWSYTNRKVMVWFPTLAVYMSKCPWAEPQNDPGGSSIGVRGHMNGYCFWWAGGTLHGSLSHQSMNMCMRGCKMTIVLSTKELNKI